MPVETIESVATHSSRLQPSIIWPSYSLDVLLLWHPNLWPHVRDEGSGQPWKNDGASWSSFLPRTRLDHHRLFHCFQVCETVIRCILEKFRNKQIDWLILTLFYFNIYFTMEPKINEDPAFINIICIIFIYSNRFDYMTELISYRADFVKFSNNNRTCIAAGREMNRFNARMLEQSENYTVKK